MNTVINNAVSKLNEVAQANTEAAAIRLVGMILAERAAITSQEAQIMGFQKQLVAIQEAVVTDTKVLGAPLPPEAQQTANQKTIAAVIAKLNKGAQGDVEAQSTNLANRITSAQAQIAACQKRIEEFTKDLTALEAKVLTPEAVVGA